jgi:hypothetical protein
MYILSYLSPFIPQSTTAIELACEESHLHSLRVFLEIQFRFLVRLSYILLYGLFQFPKSLSLFISSEHRIRVDTTPALYS